MSVDTQPNGLRAVLGGDGLSIVNNMKAFSVDFWQVAISRRFVWAQSRKIVNVFLGGEGDGGICLLSKIKVLR